MANTIQLTIMFTQYVPCSSKWIELAGGVLNTNFVYDEEKIANSDEVFLSLKDTDMPTCLDIDLRSMMTICRHMIVCQRKPTP